MSVIKPFQSVRPAKGLVSRIAALPYDVYNRKEAKDIVSANPMSFLKIDRAETMFPDDQDMYAPKVYEKARSTFQEMLENGAFIREENESFYLYELTMNGHTQTGLVACASIDDYINGIIKKHENTREEKELDRIRHVDTISAQTGPIFLAYRPHPEMYRLTSKIKEREALYDFTGEDTVRHRVWIIDSPSEISHITNIFSEISQIYIADGHHRAASAVKVGLKRRAAHPDYRGNEEFNYFLSVIFPSDELKIFDYNRVVADLNGHTFTDFLAQIEAFFTILPVGSQPYVPQTKGEFGLYGNGRWYCLRQKQEPDASDPVASLDVSILQNTVLNPILGIKDPKTDSRISFVGGIRGLKELQDMVDAQGGGVAFSLFPTSMQELLAVADAGMLMPPKSTWFEPKLRSGIFIHEIEK